jgi:hypothetical protein
MWKVRALPNIYQELGEHLEDASHVIDDTDSDQSVIEE